MYSRLSRTTQVPKTTAGVPPPAVGPAGAAGGARAPGRVRDRGRGTGKGVDGVGVGTEIEGNVKLRFRNKELIHSLCKYFQILGETAVGGHRRGGRGREARAGGRGTSGRGRGRSAACPRSGRDIPAVSRGFSRL